MVFARKPGDALTSLVKNLDAATTQHADRKLASFVVFCDDDPDLPALKALAGKLDLKWTTLTIEGPGGPKGYNLAKDTDVQVIFYVEHKVKVSKVYKKDQLKSADVEQLVSDGLKAILP